MELHYSLSRLGHIGRGVSGDRLEHVGYLYASLISREFDILFPTFRPTSEGGNIFGSSMES